MYWCRYLSGFFKYKPTFKQLFYYLQFTGHYKVTASWSCSLKYFRFMSITDTFDERPIKKTFTISQDVNVDLFGSYKCPPTCNPFAARLFSLVHHKGRRGIPCSHVISDLPLGSHWTSRLCLGSSCPLMWWLRAVGFSWTHSPRRLLATSFSALFILPNMELEREAEYGKRRCQGSRPSQITRNFCLTSLEVANTGKERVCVF